MKKNYSDLLKDPRWQKKRLHIMERDEFTCQCCFDDKNTLNVHHKYYIANRKPWEYPDELLITLCENCHKCEEDAKSIISDFTKVLLSDGYMNHSLVELLEWLRRLPSAEYGISYIMDAVKSYEESKNNE